SDIHFLYARSFFLETLPTSPELGDILKLYLNECQDQWMTRSLYEKGMIALVHFRYGDKQLSRKVMEALSEQAVHSEENGMYWKENRSGWYWYHAPIETQALLIEAFTEIVNNKEKIEQLKLWLLKNKRTQSWETTKATTEAVYALLMQGSSWLSVAENTRITVGNEIIRPEKDKTIEKEAGTGYLKRSWTPEEIESRMGAVTVENRGEVSGYGGVYWQYFEDLDKIKKTGSGPLVINKGIYLKSQTTEGTQLQPLHKVSKSKVGDLLTVRLEITAKENLEFIHLKDLRGSGLEPLDVLSEYKWQDGLGYYQTSKDVATHFFFDQLPKGTYVFEYDLRINNAGDFSTGISNIQSMYAPEFSAHSQGVRMNVERIE
ncbi:MAG: alpha-2-macroglobulin, partial [Xenococcus sp. (in: cyanobacteria)]